MVQCWGRRSLLCCPASPDRWRRSGDDGRTGADFVGTLFPMLARLAPSSRFDAWHACRVRIQTTGEQRSAKSLQLRPGRAAPRRSLAQLAADGHSWRRAGHQLAPAVPDDGAAPLWWGQDSLWRPQLPLALAASRASAPQKPCQLEPLPDRDGRRQAVRCASSRSRRRPKPKQRSWGWPGCSTIAPAHSQGACILIPAPEARGLCSPCPTQQDRRLQRVQTACKSHRGQLLAHEHAGKAGPSAESLPKSRPRSQFSRRPARQLPRP